jgi:glycosyltransferase involved in cell wall biosynthesis
MKRLSIIVPIYNVEKYVERCLRSLEDQDIPKDEYEIICVNDGSSDNSQAVVKRLQEEFENIILINQENQGVSRARNNGIDKACGKYLLFIDPDDYVEINRFSDILQKTDEQEAQISFLGFTILNEDGLIKKNVFYEEYTKRIFNGIEAYFLSRGDGSTDPDRMWAVLYKTEFINFHSLRYLPDVPYLEDGEFIARILCFAEYCIFDGSSFYQRTSRPGSATHSSLFHSERAINGFLRAALNLKTFQNTQSLKENQKVFLNQPLCKFIILVVDSSRSHLTLEGLKNLKRNLIESGFEKLDLESVDSEYTRLGSIYNFSISFLVCYLYFINKFKALTLMIRRD